MNARYIIIIFLCIMFPIYCYAFSWGQIELHHIFPQDYNYRSWFATKDIDPDIWCIPLTREKHTGKYNGIHYKKYNLSGGKNFNQSWDYFIKDNPNASREETFLFALELLAEFGIDLRKEKFYNYRTKNISGVKFPNISTTTKILNYALRIGKKITKIGRLNPELYIIEETISNIDKPFKDEVIQENDRIITYLSDGHLPKIESCDSFSFDINQLLINDEDIDKLVSFYTINSKYWMSSYKDKKDFCKKSISEIHKYITNNGIRTHQKFLGLF